MIKRCILAAACVLAAPALLAQNGESEPFVPEGVTVKLGDHTYAIPDQDRPAVPNVGIVVGERATLVIDPGMGRRNGEAVLREVAKVSDNERLYIASTHFHPEHTTGYLAFPESAKYVNSNVQEQEFAESGQRIISFFERRGPVMAALLEGVERREADITFDEEYKLDLGGVTVTMLVVGPTHTRGDTGFFVAEDRVLFAGDVVMNNSFLAANDNSSVSAWLDAFDRFETLGPEEKGPETIVPAHGDIGDASLISTQRDIVRHIRDRAQALKADGKPADDAAEIIDRELRSQHPDWPRAQGIAPLARAAWRE